MARMTTSQISLLLGSALALCLSLGPSHSQSPAATNLTSKADIDPDRYRDAVAKLTSSPMDDRAVGTPGGAEAIRFIEAKFREAGLLPPTPGGGYLQNYQHSYQGKAAAANVVGILPGVDPALKRQVVVVSAHHDHLGWKLDSGCPDALAGECVNPGANDNASGSAALLELAFALAKRKGELKRTVVFLSFDGEACGCTGSRHYVVKSPLFPLEDTIYNLNLDQIGEGGRLVHHPIYMSTPEDADCELDGEVFARRGVKAQTLVGENAHHDLCTDVIANMDFGKAMQTVELAYDLVWKATQD